MTAAQAQIEADMAELEYQLAEVEEDAGTAKELVENPCAPVDGDLPIMDSAFTTEVLCHTGLHFVLEGAVCTRCGPSPDCAHGCLAESCAKCAGREP